MVIGNKSRGSSPGEFGESSEWEMLGQNTTLLNPHSCS